MRSRPLSPVLTLTVAPFGSVLSDNVFCKSEPSSPLPSVCRCSSRAEGGAGGGGAGGGRDAVKARARACDAGELRSALVPPSESVLATETVPAPWRRRHRLLFPHLNFYALRPLSLASQSATQWALVLATGVAVAATFLAVRARSPPSGSVLIVSAEGSVMRSVCRRPGPANGVCTTAMLLGAKARRRGGGSV